MTIKPMVRRDFLLRLSLCWHTPYLERIKIWKQYLFNGGLDHEARNQFNKISIKQIDIATKWLDQRNHHLINIAAPSYPASLKEIYRPPLTLYIWGTPEILNNPQIAIVGSRNPTPTGKAHAFHFSQQLAQRGYTITSGLALGIDGQAHRGAMAANKSTIAVLGCGLNHRYPRRNQALYPEIAHQGAIISEYPLHVAPQACLFPQRNRLISGLSLGVLVVEAAIKSGSLITARLAGEQGRDVFAIPGSLSNPLSRGCHKLINQGAKLVECTEDIVVELPAIEDNRPPGAANDCKKSIQNNNSGLDAHCQLLLECLQTEALSLEQLLNRGQLPMQTTQQSLVELELSGKIIVKNGRYYRVRMA